MSMIVSDRLEGKFLHTYRSNHRRCSIKKMLLKSSQNSQVNTCVGVSFLRTPFLQNTFGRLLLYIRAHFLRTCSRDFQKSPEQQLEHLVTVFYIQFQTYKLLNSACKLLSNAIRNPLTTNVPLIEISQYWFANQLYDEKIGF